MRSKDVNVGHQMLGLQYHYNCVQNYFKFGTFCHLKLVNLSTLCLIIFSET